MQLSDYENKSIKKLGESIMSGKWSNEGLVQIIELTGSFLNLMSVSDFARKNGISYQGARKNTKDRTVIKLLDTKFVIDNE